MSREELKTIIISRFRQVIRESGMTVQELAGIGLLPQLRGGYARGGRQG